MLIDFRCGCHLRSFFREDGNEGVTFMRCKLHPEIPTNRSVVMVRLEQGGKCYKATPVPLTEEEVQEYHKVIMERLSEPIKEVRGAMKKLVSHLTLVK